MDKQLFDLVAEHTPRMNDMVVDGWAVHEMKSVEAHVDRIFRTAAEDFPPELRYLGYQRCTPYEEFNEITKKQSSQASHELARSDLYLVKYRFSFQGEELEPRYLYLPFVSDAGTIYIRGSEFAIAPVLADKAISVGTDSIFIPLNRDKLTFERLTYSFLANGVDETVFVVWSEIYHRKTAAKAQAAKSMVRGRTTLAHYLFAKYGLHRTFAMFADAAVVVGNEQTVTAENYPPHQWKICASRQFKPKGVRDRMYVSSDLRIAIPADKYNLITSSLIGGLFYIVDLFPQRVLPDYIGQEGEERLWKTLMGLLLFGSGGNEGRLVDDVDRHLASLDNYLDNESKSYLLDDDVVVDDLYQLLMYVIENFSSKVTQATSQVASMYDKRLMVRRYVLKDITNGINKFMFKVSSPKPRQRPLGKNDIVQMMRHSLKPTLVTAINRSAHGEVSSVAVPGDNKYFKVTSRVVPQVDSSGAKAKTKATSSDPAKLLHASIAEVGSFSTMSKSEPTGRDKINPHVKLAPDGLVLRDPDKIDLLDAVQRKIQRY